VTWLEAPDYWLARLVVERGIAGIYVIAFLVALNQFTPLLGERGLLPVPVFTRYVSFRASPSLFHWRYSDDLLRAVGGARVALGLAGVLRLVRVLPPPLAVAVWVPPWG